MENLTFNVYKIYSTLQPNLIYIGSTFQDIALRFSRHKYNYIHNLKSCKSKEIFDKYNFNTCKIELIETYHINPTDLIQKRKIERLYFDKYKNDHNYICVNKNRPYINKEERSQSMRDLSKSWYNKNRNEKIKSSLLSYYKKKCNSPMVNCPHCNKQVKDFYLNKHMESMKCKKGINQNQTLQQSDHILY